MSYSIAVLWRIESLARKMDTTNLVEPGFVAVGHEWYFYLGYPLPNGTRGTHILEQGSCKTDSISGIFKLLRVLIGVVEYGLVAKEGRKGDGLWGMILGAVLETLAGLRGKDEVRG
jgi:hypothetical protein